MKTKNESKRKNISNIEDVTRENALSPWEAMRLFPGVKTTVTIVRWMRVGYKGIKLRATRFGDKWHTKKEWVEEFIQQVNAINETGSPIKRGGISASRSTAGQRSRSAKRAASRLQAAGM